MDMKKNEISIEQDRRNAREAELRAAFEDADGKWARTDDDADMEAARAAKDALDACRRENAAWTNEMVALIRSGAVA